MQFCSNEKCYFYAMDSHEIIGRTCQLKIMRFSEPGCYLDGGELGEILLPNRYLDSEYHIGQKIEVFIYSDAKNRLIATTIQPCIKRDEFAYLKCKAISVHGAFMDWGLEAKDLFVPFKEQKSRLKENFSYLIYCFFDHHTGRLVGSSKINKYLDLIPPDYELNQRVKILVTGETDLGYTCIVNNCHSGMIYHNEIYNPIRVGDKISAFIKKVREDDKIDVSIHPLGVERFASITPSILDFLKDNNGVMYLTDKSDPELIKSTFSMSKKAFKKALGALYKARLIDILENKIVLTQNAH